MSTNKQEAPERIWINPGDHPADGYWYACKVVNGVEYVRADLVATARSEAFKEAIGIASVQSNTSRIVRALEAAAAKKERD